MMGRANVAVGPTITFINQRKDYQKVALGLNSRCVILS